MNLLGKPTSGKLFRCAQSSPVVHITYFQTQPPCDQRVVAKSVLVLEENADLSTSLGPSLRPLNNFLQALSNVVNLEQRRHGERIASLIKYF